MMSPLTRFGITPLNHRPEDVVSHHQMNAVLRRTAGRGLVPLHPELAPYLSQTRFLDAIALLQQGQAASSVAHVLDAGADTLAKAFITPYFVALYDAQAPDILSYPPQPYRTIPSTRRKNLTSRSKG